MFAVDTATWISAGVTLGIAFLIATVFDRVFRGRIARQVADKAGLTREGATRLRFIRRLVYAVIILIGLFIALSQFDGITNIARALLASGAIAAAVIGFAARQVLANFVAGIMLAVTQPIRVGDWVDVRGQLRRGRGRAAELHDPQAPRRTSGS